MAKIIERNILHILCDCGKETPVWSLDITEQCSCRRVYKIDSMGKLEYLGYKCWDCEEIVDKLYGEDNCCIICMDNAVEHWEDTIKGEEKSLEHSRGRLKKAKELRAGIFNE